MQDTSTLATNAVAERVAAILKRSTLEPGLREILVVNALMAESLHVQHIQVEMTPLDAVGQTTSLIPSVTR